MRAISTVALYAGEPPAPPKLISGRWVVLCYFHQQFVLHDVDRRAGAHAPQVFWELRKPVVLAWDVESVISVDGQCFVCVLFKSSDGASPEWYVSPSHGSLSEYESLYRDLLEFRLNVDTGELYDATLLDHPGSRLRKVELNAGNSHFLFIPAEPHGLVLDTRTRVFYKLPQLHDTLVCGDFDER